MSPRRQRSDKLFVRKAECLIQTGARKHTGFRPVEIRVTLSQHDLWMIHGLKTPRNLELTLEAQVVEAIYCSALDVVGSEDFVSVQLFKQDQVSGARQIRRVNAANNGGQSEERITHGQ